MSTDRLKEIREALAKKSGGGGAMGGLEGMSNKQMQKALNQMDTQEINDVTEVIVRTKTEEIVLVNPEVTIMNMGQELWNIVPQRVERRPLGSSQAIPVEKVEDMSVEVKAEDVQLIVNTVNATEEEATSALRKNNGDLAAAIMSLK